MNLEKMDIDNRGTEAIKEYHEQETEILAITWTPRPLTHGDYEPIKQFTNYVSILRNLKLKCQRLSISPELHVNGTLHFHITVWLKKSDRYTLYKTTLPQMRYKGFVKVKKVDNLLPWLDYCMKDNELMSEILEMALPLDENSDILIKLKAEHRRRKPRKGLEREIQKWEGNIVEQCKRCASSSSSSSTDDDDDE